jgi:hypothetical protein
MCLCHFETLVSKVITDVTQHRKTVSFHILVLSSARNRRLLAFLLPKAAKKETKNALCARFTARPVAGSKAKRAELAFQAQTGIPFYAFFT